MCWRWRWQTHAEIVHQLRSIITNKVYELKANKKRDTHMHFDKEI